MAEADSLAQFLPPVGQWFRTTLGEPTAAQREGWPIIASGQNALILAPTGSGKTLAAFLACLDQLWRQNPLPAGVQVLYISPLKALNNDIERNLQAPLEGITACAQQMDTPLPKIEVAVRTGDTSSADRQRQIRRPPHILITTPESLHLLLTSRGREMLKTVKYCIVDEIHALCANKRGVFLAILLERLRELTERNFVRIGLSATQRPLEEVARYLGGAEHMVARQSLADSAFPGRAWERGTESAFRDGVSERETEAGPDGLVPRSVTVIDAGLRKDLDLLIECPVRQFGALPEKSIWPSIYRLLDKHIREHRSTIIFANNRRAVERITANLNALAEEAEPGASADEFDGQAQADDDDTGTHFPPPAPRTPGPAFLARAHHGSVSLEERRATEHALKEGHLPAVVATASLELGIDMGAVDLVCQVESPGMVARGLQRIGRAGHIVGQKSKGRLIPKTAGDLLEQAVLAREMAHGRVEAIQVPVNCLDVLAQQVVAMVAVEDWDVTALYEVVRRAHPYRDLSPRAFDAVLQMVSGRYSLGESPSEAPRSSPNAMASLQPRVSWDRVHNRLMKLPGSQHLALVNGGTIPDTGQYAAYTESGARIGELDEEFIYERRIGDTFSLGTNIWRVEQIESDRVIVSPAGGSSLMPFWRGERAGRSWDLGQAIGLALDTIASKLDESDCIDWLMREFFLDRDAAWNLQSYIGRQLLHSSNLPTHRSLVIEASRDPLGDWQVLLLSPLGIKFHFALRLAIEARLEQRLGYRPQCLHHDDGILVRLADTDQPALDLFDGITSENVSDLIMGPLSDSALFALRFRQNAARALLLPRMQPGRRAPLWLQRLRGRDLLQVARHYPDFPIVAETFRECLHDHLDLPALRQVLRDIAGGTVQVHGRQCEAPSPFASGLLFAFNGAFMYQYDDTEAEGSRSPALDTSLLEQIMGPARREQLLSPAAIQTVDKRLRGVGSPPRSAAEMAEWLRRLGDLVPSELEGPMAALLEDLEAQGLVGRLQLRETHCPERWILKEEEPFYEAAFRGNEPGQRQAAAERILARFLGTRALAGLADILDRYPFQREWTERCLGRWAKEGRLVPVQLPEVEPAQWAAPANLEQIERTGLSLLRREVTSCPPAQFVDFVLRWQYLHPHNRRGSAEGLADVLTRLEGSALPPELWEDVVLPSRVPGYQRRWLDQAIASGEWAWSCRDSTESGPGGLAFWQREHLGMATVPRADDGMDSLRARVWTSLEQRGASFVSDLSAAIGAGPSAIRKSLWGLLRQGLVSNDNFDVIRKGEEAGDIDGNAHSPGRQFGRRPMRRPLSRAEGRWAAILPKLVSHEAYAIFAAGLLLNRYGVAARELAALDPGMPSWRILYEVLGRMELAGDIRRGYFVEGLSGAQFALPEAMRLLQQNAMPSLAEQPLILIHSLDPANLYGSGAPFDIPLLDGGTRPLLRRPGQWLVLRGGRPVLIVEKQGRNLTALASSSPAEIKQAVGLLPAVLGLEGGGVNHHKITVEEWNGQPVGSTGGCELLEKAGFVRDYRGMTLYAGCL
jgi:ATP-dependent Lhr-like helicase